MNIPELTTVLLSEAGGEHGTTEPSVLVVGVTVALVIIGLFFLFTGTVGLLRMPDAYNRMHATSKATTLGASSLFLANFVYFGFTGSLDIGLRAVVGIIFLFLTVPTGAHMISRSAQRMGVEFFGEAEWPIEREDELNEE